MVLRFKQDSTARHYLACIPTLTLGIMGRSATPLLLCCLEFRKNSLTKAPTDFSLVLVANSARAYTVT